MNFYMRYFFLVLVFSIRMPALSSELSLNAAPHSNDLYGTYVNPNYDKEFTPAYLEISHAEDGMAVFTVMIPCSSKSSPAVYTAQIDQTSRRIELHLVEEGGSQCYLGERLVFNFFDFSDEVELIPLPRLRTPGFDGIYRFYRR